MWSASRWTARFLLLVMLAPAYEPLAMACALRPEAMHCMRRTMSAQAAPPEMPCHHAMAQTKASPSQASPGQSSETSFQAADENCCQNRCCCGATTSERAQPASSLLSVVTLLIEPARPFYGAEIRSFDVSGYDSARAPPRS